LIFSAAVTYHFGVHWFPARRCREKEPGGGQ